MGWTLLIKLIFMCPNGIVKEREFPYKQKEYTEALADLTRWRTKLNNNYVENIDDQECKLSEVKAGSRKNK